MKNWIKKKLFAFLGINTLHKELKQENENLRNRLYSLEKMNERVIGESAVVRKENDLIMKQFNLSADINLHGREESWAVFSIKGKPEYVSFVSLGNREMREIHSFVSQFQRTNRTIDSPNREFLYREFR